MKRLLPVLLLSALGVSGGILIGQAASDPPPQVVAPITYTFLAEDVNGNGVVNSSDLLLVSLRFNARSQPNPCIQYQVFTDENPAEFPIVNSLGEPVETPRGGQFLIPSDHPAYGPLQENNVAWPIRVCTGG